jgi:ribosomal-protein-alanine N-acetyltransferase
VGIELRPYRVNDLAAMHALDVVCFEKPFRFSRGAMRRFVATKKARVVIADEGETVAAFVILHIEDDGQRCVGYIVTLDVSPGYRRRGLAGRLMQEVEQQALREGCIAIALHVFTGNEAAIRFYAGRGFVRSYREVDFYGTGMDAWVFHKPLSSARE